MKKFLLIAVAVVMSAGVYAQNEKVHKSSMSQLPMLDRQCTVATSAQSKSSRHKVMSDGIYYTRPFGTYYGDFNPYTHLGFQHTTVVAPPFMDITLNNLSTGVTAWQDTQGNDLEGDDDGNYTTMYYRHAGSAYYLPTISSRSGSYFLGEYNVYYKRGYITGVANGLVVSDSLSIMYPVDPHGSYLYNGTYYSPYQSWGVFDNDNLFGSGTQNGGKGYGAIQVFEKPISPLYVESVMIGALCPNEPIAEGTKLTMYICGVKEEEWTYSDGSSQMVKTADLDKIFQELECNSGDTLDFVSTTTRNQKTYKEGTLVFTKPGAPDVFGNVSLEPFLLTEEFAIAVVGFEQDGIDCGLYGMNALDENGDDARCTNAQFLVIGENGEEGITSHMYNGNLALQVGIYGMFDNAAVLKDPGLYTFEDESLDYSVVRVPVEGSTEDYGYGNCTDGANASAFVTGETTDPGYPGAPVFTATTWFDEEGEPFYSILDEDIPDWITGVTVDTSLYDDAVGLNIVMFQVEALPEGVEGRYADLHVVGRPVIVNVETENGETEEQTAYSTTSNVIRVVQGNVEVKEATAISNVNAKKHNFGSFYNVTGQRVNANHKGIVINNGKKQINK